MRRYRALAAGGLLLAVAAAGAWWLQQEQAAERLPDEPGQVATLLRRAVGREPLLLPRLSGGYAYRPHPEGRDLERARAIGRGPFRGPLVRAASYLERESLRRGSVAALQARAHLFLLTAAGPAPLAEALTELEAARLRDPDDAGVLSDLAAAHLLRATVEDEPYSLLLALEAADEAVDRAPRSPEPRFNRALALEALALRDEARRAWDAYLTIDRDAESDWAAEARRRRDRLAEPPPSARWAERRLEVEEAALAGDRDEVARLVADFRTDARRWLEEELFSTWAKAWSRDETEAAGRALSIAREVARAHGELTGDRLYVETVAAIERALTGAAAGPPPDRLAAGHRAYRSGFEALRAEAIDACLERFAAARAALDRGGSPFALRAAFQVGVCEHRKLRFADAIDRLTALATVAEERQYLNLQAEALWMVGLAEGGLRRFGAAQDAYASAAREFEAIGDLDNVAGIHMLRAEVLLEVGEHEAAWRDLQQALSLAGRIGNPLRLYQIYIIAAVYAWHQRLPSVALAFGDAALSHAARAGNPLALTEGHRWRSRFHKQAGDLQAAVRDLEQARRFSEEVPALQTRRLTAAGIQTAESDLLVEDDPRSALAALDETIAFYRDGDYRFPLATALFARARARLSLGDEARAEADLADSLAAYEEARTGLSYGQRVSYLEQAAAVFDRMVALRLRQGRFEDAFEVEDSRRARGLLDRLGGAAGDRETEAGAYAVSVPAASAEPRGLLRAEGLRRGLPRNAALIQFSLIDQTAGAWVVDARGMTWVELGVDHSQLETAVALLRNDLQRGAEVEVLEADGAALYERLISPLGRSLPSHLVIVPAGALQGLPFGALFNPASGRFLVEEKTLAVAPSASFYLHGLARSRAIGAAPRPGAIVLADPTFEGPAFPGATALPGASGEGREVASLYLRARLLLGEAASEAALAAQAGAYDVVHVASHALVNLDRPSLSKLLLADHPADPDDGVLHAEEIEGWRLQSTRLAVLSGCETAGGASLGSEGVASLARSFLAAGVPAVVASLWRVEDEATAELMVRFHRALLDGESAAGALRTAQRALLHGNDPALRSPAAWAAFQVIGDVTLVAPFPPLQKGDPS